MCSVLAVGGFFKLDGFAQSAFSVDRRRHCLHKVEEVIFNLPSADFAFPPPPIQKGMFLKIVWWGSSRKIYGGQGFSWKRRWKRPLPPLCKKGFFWQRKMHLRDKPECTGLATVCFIFLKSCYNLAHLVTLCCIIPGGKRGPKSVSFKELLRPPPDIATFPSQVIATDCRWLALRQRFCVSCELCFNGPLCRLCSIQLTCQSRPFRREERAWPF